MAEHAVQTAGQASDYHFLLRRLHSLTGLVPIGAYLVVHLLTNASILAGPEIFQANVDRIHELEKLRVLLVVEILFIFAPLLFHTVLGFIIWFGGVPNAAHYRYGPNYRYTLQRITGGIAAAFILYHVWEMHWLFAWAGGGEFDAHDAAASTAHVITRGWAAPLYAIGVLACVYHLANGIWTSLITWGITIGPRSQRASGYACTAFGILLAVVGLGALFGFIRFEPGEAVPVEHGVAARVEVESSTQN